MGGGRSEGQRADEELHEWPAVGRVQEATNGHRRCSDGGEPVALVTHTLKSGYQHRGESGNVLAPAVPGIGADDRRYHGNVGRVQSMTAGTSWSHGGRRGGNAKVPGTATATRVGVDCHRHDDVATNESRGPHGGDGRVKSMTIGAG